MPMQFNGHIELDVRDSTPDWDAFLSDRAPRGSPNVLVVLYDDTGLAANTHGSFKILAEVDFSGDSQGVIVAQGSRFGGYSLFVKDGTIAHVYNFLGIPPEERHLAAAMARD